MVVAAALTLAGCAATPAETPAETPAATPEPAAIPTGTLQPHGAAATGDIVELGQGQALDVGWRYAIYPSDEGWCTQLETAGVTAAGCGSTLPSGENAFGSVSIGELAPGGVTTVEGMVSGETATVWMIGEGDARAPAVLMSLEPAELDGRAFLGFAPADVVLTHLQAVAENGDVLETYELP